MKSGKSRQRFFLQWLSGSTHGDAAADGTFFKYMWNSAYTAVIITAVILINSAMFAYAAGSYPFSREKYFDRIDHDYIHYAGQYNLCAIICDFIKIRIDEYPCQAIFFPVVQVFLISFS